MSVLFRSSSLEGTYESNHHGYIAVKGIQYMIGPELFVVSYMGPYPTIPPPLPLAEITTMAPAGGGGDVEQIKDSKKARYYSFYSFH
jgi:hypothetical protein